MNDDIGALANPTTNVTKSNDPQASRLELRTISEADFKNFTNTGLIVTIPVPLAQNSAEAVFAINVDGFIPIPKMSANLFRNTFPVQLTNASYNLSGASIKWTRSSLPVQIDYLSYRMVSGFVGICLRLISQTAQSGNFMVTQASGINRRYYAPSENYEGLRFNNQSQVGIDYAPNGFVIIDLSLNRNVAILPTRRENTAKVDLAKKLAGINSITSNTDTNNNMALSTQFLEDWLLFTPTGDIPRDSSSQISFQIYFDWSRVTFELPMYPVIPLPVESNLQILLFLTTFNNKNVNTLGGYTTYTWWPRDVPHTTSELLKKAVMNSPIVSADGKIYTYLTDTVTRHSDKYTSTTKAPTTTSTTTDNE